MNKNKVKIIVRDFMYRVFPGMIAELMLIVYLYASGQLAFTLYPFKSAICNDAAQAYLHLPALFLISYLLTYTTIIIVASIVASIMKPSSSLDISIDNRKKSKRVFVDRDEYQVFDEGDFLSIRKVSPGLRGPLIILAILIWIVSPIIVFIMWIIRSIRICFSSQDVLKDDTLISLQNEIKKEISNQDEGKKSKTFKILVLITTLFFVVSASMSFPLSIIAICQSQKYHWDEINIVIERTIDLKSKKEDVYYYDVIYKMCFSKYQNEMSEVTGYLSFDMDGQKVEFDGGNYAVDEDGYFYLKTKNLDIQSYDNQDFLNNNCEYSFVLSGAKFDEGEFYYGRLHKAIVLYESKPAAEVEDNIYSSTSQNTDEDESSVFNLTLNANGGLINETSVKVKYGKPYSLPTPTLYGYTFQGWFLNDANIPTDGVSWEYSTSSVTLYASWEAKTLCLTLDPSGGTINESTISITYNGAYTLPIPSYSLGAASYGFEGWYLGKTKIPTSGDNWAYSAEDSTLAARWFDNLVFGSYPQTEVTDATLASVLTKKAGIIPTSSSQGTWISYNYYIDGETSDFMWYQDIAYNDEKYRGVYFNDYRPTYCSSTASIDKSSQDDNGYYINNLYWFKWEPIQWRILSTSSDDAFLITDKVIDSQQYYHEKSNEKKIRRPYDSSSMENVYDNNYKYSDIRGWLNTEFYDDAFGDNIKNYIKTTSVDNSALSTGYTSNPYVCDDTYDKVFLLSSKEVNDNKNICETYATDYARCQGTIMNNGIAGYWWTRSTTYTSGGTKASAWRNGLDSLYDIRVNISSVGIRPALHISH